MVNIEQMLKKAVFDDVIYCPYCEYGLLEPDYERCPECHRPNPLRQQGLI